MLKRRAAISSLISRYGRNSASSRGPIFPFVAGSAGAALLLLVYLAIIWGNFEGVNKAIYAFTELFSDFVIYYYPMGGSIFRTGLPVSGFLYSPFIAILMAGFSPLGIGASLVLWGILQAFFVFLYLLLFRRLVPAGLKFQLLFIALTLFSFPLVLNLLGGQVSVFMIVAILGMLVLYERGRRVSGAGLLAFAVSFKFYPAIFIVPFAARRDARFLLFTAAACVALLFFVPGILLGIGDTLGFYSALLSSFRDSSWVTANPHSQYFPHLVLRLGDALGTDVRAFLPLLRWIGYGIAAANMGLIYLLQRARIRNADLWSFQVVFLTIPFVLKTSWAHDFVFLPFTQALLIWFLLERRKGTLNTGTSQRWFHSSVRARTRTAITFILLLLSIVFTNIVFFNLFGDFAGYGICGFLFWADLFLLIALYVQFLPRALREPRQETDVRVESERKIVRADLR